MKKNIKQKHGEKLYDGRTQNMQLGESILNKEVSGITPSAAYKVLACPAHLKVQIANLEC